jgi:hypothetical protein
MLLVDIFFALMLALLFTAIFGLGFRGYRPGTALLMFFLLLFLLTWTGGVWVAPFGPALWGVPWGGFLIVGLVVAILLAALMPPEPPRPARPSEVEAEERGEAAAFAVINVFFWLLVVMLLTGLLVHYL